MNRILSAKTMALALLLVVALIAAACAGDAGDRGSKGDRGATGADGAAGDQGPAGADGERGARGVVGIEGIPGLPGPQGVQGLVGPSLNASITVADWIREPGVSGVTVYGAGFEPGESIAVLVAFPDDSLALLGGGDVIVADAIGTFSVSGSGLTLDDEGLYAITANGSEGSAASAVVVVVEK